MKISERVHVAKVAMTTNAMATRQYKGRTGENITVKLAPTTSISGQISMEICACVDVSETFVFL